MSSKTQQLTNVGMFYKQIGDFKDKIILILEQFGKQKEIVELKKYYDKLIEFKNINPRKPIELFYEHGVLAYIDDILVRNDKFFMKHVSSLIENEEIGDKHDVMFISHIKEIWGDLQETVKNNIWKYIQVLSILAENVVGDKKMTERKHQLKTEGKIV